MSMLKSGLRSRDIITRKAIENSIVVVYSLGGSTNAFLHILAIAHEAEVPITIQEIGEIGKPVPLLGNMRPHGRWHMSDLSKIGANSQSTNRQASAILSACALVVRDVGAVHSVGTWYGVVQQAVFLS